MEGMKPDPDILAHYDSFDESGRLAADSSRLEFARTCDIFSRNAPPPPARVLDVGGGPGVYACWLARQGYEVRLIDPVPRHVEQAREASAAQPDHPIAGALAGDARDLPFDDGFADVVLLMGPLYHLTEKEERLRALREARRTLRPGGLLLAAGISRYASLLDGTFRGFRDDPDFARIVDRDLTEGQHRNPTGNPSYFTTAFFHHPEELAAETREAGFQEQNVVAVEGPMWLLSTFDEIWSDPARRRSLLADTRRIESEPSMLGVSAHLLAVARKA